MTRVEGNLQAGVLLQTKRDIHPHLLCPTRPSRSLPAVHVVAMYEPVAVEGAASICVLAEMSSTEAEVHVDSDQLFAEFEAYPFSSDADFKVCHRNPFFPGPRQASDPL